MGWEDRLRPRGGGGGGKGGKGPYEPPIKLPDFKIPDFKIPPINKGMILTAVMVLISLWLLTGFYKVELNERGVVMLFGKYIKESQPGLNWFFPRPIGEVVKVRVEEIKRVEVGFRSRTGRAPSPRAFEEESLMLTKNVNMIDIDLVVQYQVTDPVEFLFKIADVQRGLVDRGLLETVRKVAEASLREVVGRTEIDKILTTDKGRVQREIATLMQEILDKYESGLTINLVQLQDVHPPQEVKAAFKDVNNAEEDKIRQIREAEGYWNSVIPVTRGKVARVINEAEAYMQEKVAKAKGDAGRFGSQLAEYRKAKDITRKRLYLEAMETVLGKSKKIIMSKETAGKMLPILPFGDLTGAGGGK